MLQYTKRIKGGAGVNPFVAAEWYNTVGRFLETFRVVVWDGAYPFVDRANGDGSDWTIYIPAASAPTKTSYYAFEATRASTTAISVRPGDVWLGPITKIAWASITNAATTPAVDATDTCVWLIVDLSTQTAEMYVGTRSAMEGSVSGAALATKLLVPLVETVWTAGVITEVVNLQCGDVKIARA